MSMIILVISIILNLYLILRLLISQGVLEVDYSDKDKPRWLFLLKISTDDIHKYHRLIFKVKDVTELVKETKTKEKEK